MNATAKFDFGKFPAGQAFTIRLMLTLEGDTYKKKERSPLNLALVLDRSGSMHGAKLTNVKEATKLLVSKLSKDDIFSLTIFDDKVKRLVAPVRIGESHDLAITIDKIRSGGSTFLSGGYEEGCTLAAGNNAGDYVSRVILLTDGLANVGIQDPEKLAAFAGSLREKGISTTTIGVGNDYDESLLGKIAGNGGGGTYFIETPNDAPGVFTEELGCLQSLVATDCEVRFVPEMGGVRFGQLNTYDISRNRAFLLGDIYGGQQKTLVLEIELPPMHVAPNIVLGIFEVTYRDTTTEKMETKHIRVPAAISVVAQADFAGAVPDRDVTLQACFLTIAHAKAESMELADAGNYEDAASLLEKYIEAIRELNLEDAALERELRELGKRAKNFRDGGHNFFTVNERKRMFYEASMMSKNRTANYTAMMKRRPDDREEE